jgi:hypothetical protein
MNLNSENSELFSLTLEGSKNLSVQITVKAGIMATMEISVSDGDMNIPKEKINALVSNEETGPVAWVQISQFSDNGATQIVTHEGFIHADQRVLVGRGEGAAVRGSLSSVKELSPDLEAYIAKVRNGLFACCTSSGTKIRDGSACSITCCNASNCSDSTCSGCSCSPLLSVAPQ